MAATLPTVVLAGAQVTFALTEQRHSTERVMLERAEKITLLADAEMRSDLSGLRALATARSLHRRDVKDFAARAREALELEPTWKALTLRDAASGRVLATVVKAAPGITGRALTRDAPASPPQPGGLPMLSADGTALIVAVAAPANAARPAYTLSLDIDTAYFQRLLLHNAPDEIAAIVSSDGRFVARTANYEQRRGQLASHYLRDAMRTSKRGVYHGFTLEGLDNYTAFQMSPTTGLSTHIAMPRWRLDGPRLATVLTVIGVGALALTFAFILVGLVLKDLAERRAVETALGQTQKLESIGRMTGGLAHDFSNIVAAFGSGLRIIRKEAALTPRGETVMTELESIEERARTLARRLLDFSRTQDVEIERVDVPQLVTGLESLLRHTLGPDVDLDLSVAPETGFAATNAHQLEMALLNLAANARDAMPDGGRVTVSAELAPTRRAVDIVVADTGAGMTEEVRARALEPFFTTKPAGQGTGLGLAQVFSLARRSKGEVSIESTPGSGTRVRIRLPRIVEQLTAPER